jgi:cytochrome c-type biogenesis protein CcmH/NrfF
MIGGYVATFTAFCVVNVKFLPKLAVWLLPTVIGTMGIAMWTAYYRRKFRRV